jgi:hypothetical protein
VVRFDELAAACADGEWRRRPTWRSKRPWGTGRWRSRRIP